MGGAKFLFIIPLIVAYILINLVQHKQLKKEEITLELIPHAALLKAATGYLHQLSAEVFFVNSTIFLGGIKPGSDPEIYAPVLAHNYKQIVDLYPQFEDPYYYTQAYLAYVAPKFTYLANEILEVGSKTYPKNHIYPFFIGYNLFGYLEEPLKAAEVFREASKIEGAPPMFGHFEIILTAEGGQLEAAILSLKVLLRNPLEEDSVKNRYFEELIMFQDALKVQKAVEAFYHEKSHYPEKLEDLVPGYIIALPSFGNAFDITWNPPVVGLKRPKVFFGKPAKKD